MSNINIFHVTQFPVGGIFYCEQIFAISEKMQGRAQKILKGGSEISFEGDLILKLRNFLGE